MTGSREQERLATYKAKVDSAVGAYNELLEVPSYTSATFSPASEGISTSSQLDHLH